MSQQLDAAREALAEAGIVCISLETLRDWHQQAEALVDSYGSGYGLMAEIEDTINEFETSK